MHSFFPGRRDGTEANELDIISLYMAVFVHGSYYRLIGCCVFLILFFAGCTPAAEEPPADSQTQTRAAVMLAPNVISSELPEFATSFSPDGNTVYFNRTNEDRSKLQIMYSKKIGDVWDEPVALPFSDGTFFDIDPFVSPDGSRLYFNSDRPLEGDSSKDLDTWYVEIQDEGWGEPVNPGAPLNGAEDEVFFSITKRNTAYFSIARDGVRKIYRSEYVDGSYQAPMRLDLNVGDSIGVGNPLIDPDERFLLFTSSQLDGIGNADIYIADHQGAGVFGRVRNLGEAVNSSFAEFAPGLSPGGESLFFTSERPGIVGPLSEGRPPGDLYSVAFEP